MEEEKETEGIKTRKPKKLVLKPRDKTTFKSLRPLSLHFLKTLNKSQLLEGILLREMAVENIRVENLSTKKNALILAFNRDKVVKKSNPEQFYDIVREKKHVNLEDKYQHLEIKFGELNKEYTKLFRTQNRVVDEDIPKLKANNSKKREVVQTTKKSNPEQFYDKVSKEKYDNLEDKYQHLKIKFRELNKEYTKLFRTQNRVVDEDIPKLKANNSEKRKGVQLKRLQCPKCEHHWKTRSNLIYVTCPSCHKKMKS